MSLSSEAAHLYLYSKELKNVNKRLKRLSGKAQKHAHRHSKAPEHKKHKHLKRHSKVKGEINRLMKTHNQILLQIKHQIVKYNDALRKEHKL